MKRKLSALSLQYAAALKKHLRSRSRSDLQPALQLGRRAAYLGLETLELARMHEQSLVAIGCQKLTNGRIERAETFFAQAIIPITETSDAARRSQSELKRLGKMLSRRTIALTSAKQQLQRGIVRRKRAETALKTSAVHWGSLLKDSQQLQEDLRQLTHRLLAAQEKERGDVSRELQDEIVQTLLGINVRLLSLKKGARDNSAELRREIAHTQQLVAHSAESVLRVAQEFRNA